MTNWTLIRCLLILSVFEWICQEVNQTRIKVYYPMSSNSTNSFNSYDYLSHDISPFRIGVFCHKCGKDDFRQNTRSLSSNVRYCKSKKTDTQSNLARRNQQDNVDAQRHDVGTDLFSFLVRKQKDQPESVHLHGGQDDSILSVIQEKWPPKSCHQRNPCWILQNHATESRQASWKTLFTFSPICTNVYTNSQWRTNKFWSIVARSLLFFFSGHKMSLK